MDLEPAPAQRLDLAKDERVRERGVVRGDVGEPRLGLHHRPMTAGRRPSSVARPLMRGS